MATQDAHKELFLDILTKEEREALLNKKMENLRKQNEAIQKRYAEVEADKKRADVKLGSKLPAQKETYIVPRALPPSEDHDPRKIKQTQQQQQQQQSQQQQQLLQQQQQQLQQQQQQLQQQQQQLQQPQNSRPATRNKPPPAQGGGGGRGARERPKSQDFRSEAGYQYEPIVDIADLDSRHAKRALSPSKARRNAPKENAPVVSNNTHTSLPPGGAFEASNSFYHPRQSRSYGNRDDQSHANLGRGGRRGRVYTQTFNSHKEGSDPFEYGPPPDPAYNYLADRTRESNAGGRQIEKSSSQDGFVGGGGSTRGGKDLRRHPRNFGGQDFTNVRQQMKTVKEKEKDRRSFPPRNRLEMSVNMTGTERVQYDEWKTERQKVDQDRIDRQKTSSGEWRRAWDQEKHQREYEEQSSSNRTEPARRPAPSAVQNIPPPEVLDRKPPGAGRGRGRGRGRARAQQGGESGRPGERPPRPRTWSGGDESRTVECSNDMLVVKIDKSRSSDDHSVEVEYEEPEKRKSSPTKKKPTRRSPTKQKQQHLQHPPQFQDADIHPGAKGVSPPLLTTMSSQDSSNYDGRPASLSQSLSIGSTDDWETTEDEGEALRRTAKLNPEAPVFQPNSPDLTISPPVQSGFGLPPKEQRTNRSSRVAGGLTGSLNVAASSFGGPTSASSPKAAPLTSVKIAEETTVNGKAADDIAEEEEEDGEEEETLAERELEDVDEEEDDEEYFHDSEDKVEKEGEEELPSESHDSQEEKDSREEAEAQGESSLADELSGSTPSSSLADELSAAGAPRPHADGLHAHESVKDDPASQDVHEIEEDDEIEDDEDESVPVEEEKDTVEEEKDTVEEEKDTVEEKKESVLVEEKKESVPVKEQKETVPVVSDDTVPKGESLPETATASDETATEEEKKHASQDADSSCSSAPADGSSGSSPMPSGKQMAAKEEEGGSQEGAMEPSSSQLTSSATEGTKESAKSDVMEKPDAEHVNGDTTEATALSEDSFATETMSTTSLSA
ncbi:nucleolar and coiled-body phosphoprotein 1-like isoform X2 [Littorina saxatilis]|uniref:nucleolar and coiled-body phosphoprotein 1-like isoform X2 n=1 Tax=Littorina saxatilis TaxID=31220 RepID=UPI0038B616E2